MGGVVSIVKAVIKAIAKNDKAILNTKTPVIQKVVTESEPYVFNPLKFYGKPVTEHSKEYLNNLVADMSSVRGFDYIDLKSVIEKTDNLDHLKKITNYMVDTKKTANLPSKQLHELQTSLLSKLKSFEEHDLLIKMKYLITEYAQDLF